MKQRLLENTQRAVERGVFGSPSFFVGDELFFGKDQLRDVEEEITEAKGCVMAGKQRERGNRRGRRLYRGRDCQEIRR